MLINLRGTHGAGKSTIVRTLLDANDARPLYGALGRRPEAYQLMLAGKPTYVLGPYESPCGGADCIQTFPLLCSLVEKYAAVGDVVFEGIVSGSCWGVIGKLLERWQRESLIVFLDTTIDECILRVKARRALRGDSRAFDPANLIQKHAAIVRLKQKLDAAGIVRTITVSSEHAAAKVAFFVNQKGD